MFRSGVEKKGYKAFHEFENSDKGHHDKEKHKHEYDEENGEEEKKHEEAGHFGEEHQGEEGEKNAKFGEDGKHQKGYSTKGEHSVFKKVWITQLHAVSRHSTKLISF